MAIWNRRVTVSDDGQYLEIDTLTPAPNPPGNQDPAETITTRTADRPATINYLPAGPRLTRIEMKDGSDIPSWLTVSNVGATLRIVDNGEPGTDASYYLVGARRDAPDDPIRSRDPRIDNR